jgi:ribonuclease Z
MSIPNWSQRRLLIAAFVSAFIAHLGASTGEGIRLPEAVPGGAAQSGSGYLLKVVVVGSGGGPAVNLQRFGPSVLVEAGNQLLLFDCGRGATIRLTQLGVPLPRVNKLFLTHLHSDHVIGVPDLYLTGWVGRAGRNVPFEVWGPAGTQEMMEHMQRTFAFDIHIRRDVVPKLSKDGITVVSRDIEQGTVFENDGLKVTAFLVDHGSVKPALGYRIDYRERSVALSGDTRLSENLIKFAQGVDVLIHEATAGNVSGITAEARAQQESVIALHTLPEEAGEVFSRVKPRLAVYAHAPISEALIARTRKTYSGPLEGADDLMTIEIGQTITVRRFSR